MEHQDTLIWLSFWSLFPHNPPATGHTSRPPSRQSSTVLPTAPQIHVWTTDPRPVIHMMSRAQPHLHKSYVSHVSSTKRFVPVFRSYFALQASTSTPDKLTASACQAWLHPPRLPTLITQASPSVVLLSLAVSCCILHHARLGRPLNLLASTIERNGVHTLHGCVLYLGTTLSGALQQIISLHIPFLQDSNWDMTPYSGTNVL